MKKLLLIVVAVLLAGCGNGSQEVGEGLYRSYDKENGVGFCGVGGFWRLLCHDVCDPELVGFFKEPVDCVLVAFDPVDAEVLPAYA